jgi:hypothetical protein
VLLLSAVLPASAQQITVSNSKSLDFGRFVAGSGGTVMVAPSGLRTRTGGVVLLNSPTAGAAAFLLTKNGGTTSKAVVITLPANGSVTLTSGSNSMPVNNFVSNPATILSLPANGLTLTVGATMTAAPNQPAGNYSGSFPLIVNFQ